MIRGWGMALFTARARRYSSYKEGEGEKPAKGSGGCEAQTGEDDYSGNSIEKKSPQRPGDRYPEGPRLETCKPSDESDTGVVPI